MSDTKTAPKTTKTKAPAPKTISVVDIARDEELNPKVVRAKLRRIYADEEAAKKLPKPVSETRWEFASKDRARVKKLVAA